MIEKERSLETGQSAAFVLSNTTGGCFLIHPFLTERPSVRGSDLDALTDCQLLRRRPGSGGGPLYDITPLGRRYYAEMKRRSGAAAEVIDKEIRGFLDGQAFMNVYPAAYSRWSEAERELWGAEGTAQLTRIGHACREALQEFAVALARRRGVGVPADRAKTVRLIRAVLETLPLGNTDSKFLEALLAYWGTVSDLVQRQEHGAARENESLSWEDARRVVFQTAIVMFEFARAAG